MLGQMRSTNPLTFCYRQLGVVLSICLLQGEGVTGDGVCFLLGLRGPTWGLPRASAVTSSCGFFLDKRSNMEIAARVRGDFQLRLFSWTSAPERWQP